MAKQQSNNPEPAEVVIFFARARGGGDVVAQSVRALAEAVERATQPRPPARIMTKALPATNGQTQEKTLFDQGEDINEQENVEVDSEVAETIAANGTRKKRGDGDPQDRNAGILPVGDIDFVPKGKDSLKSFFASKNATSDMDQILVFCDFFQNVLSLSKYGVGHLLSAFRHVGKPVPKDLRGTVRNMRKRAWLAFTDIEEIRMTTVGKNLVDHELGKDSGKAGA